MIWRFQLLQFQNQEMLLQLDKLELFSRNCQMHQSFFGTTKQKNQLPS
jgi:hypothetical protein